MTPVSSSISTGLLDGLSEVTELGLLPLPYKDLYHTLVLKNEMPIDLLRDKHRSGSQQLLTWIQAALALLETVSDQSTPMDPIKPIMSSAASAAQGGATGAPGARLVAAATSATTTTAAATTTTTTMTSTTTTTQRQFQRDEEEDEELEAEIQDVVSGFGQYEPTIESSIEILLQLEEKLAERTSTSATHSSVEDEDEDEDDQDEIHLSPEIEAVLEKWSRLRGIIVDLNGSIREHQRLRDGIQSIRNISEQTRLATGILNKCLNDIAADRQRTNELAMQDISRNGSTDSLNSVNSSGSVRDRSRSSGVDSNDMLELDSRLGLLSLQIDTFQKSYPESIKAGKALKNKGRNFKQQETGSIADKKYVLYRLYKDLLKDWHGLRTRKDQLWRDLEECDRWRTRIEKMAKQIETMLEPVEIFHKMCINLLANLDRQQTLTSISASSSEDDQSDIASQPSLTMAMIDTSMAPISFTALSNSISSMDPHAWERNDPVDLETLWNTLQELDEKQSMVAPAIENMFWVQEGEMQHRAKTAAPPQQHSPTTPNASSSADASHPFSNPRASSPSSTSMENSPLYPSLAMLERQRRLKNRWSNLKTSLDKVGTRLHAHHTMMKEKANQALIRKEEHAEDKTLVGSGASVDGNDWPKSPKLRRTGTNVSQQSMRPVSPNWKPAGNRFLQSKIIPSVPVDPLTSRKYMLVKSDKPIWDKPRPWCPSAAPSSPGMPGFPLQTSTWGYYIMGTSLEPENYGQPIATPAPPLPMLRASTPKPPPPPKIHRPPFSPGGNRKTTSFTRPTPPTPSRSVSVAGGDFRVGTMTASGDRIDWSKTLRRSSSFTNVPKPHPSARRRNTAPVNKLKRGGSTIEEVRQGQGNDKLSNEGYVSPTTRRNSTASQQGLPGDLLDKNKGDQGGEKTMGRRSSVSSSDEEGTIMGQQPGALRKNGHHGQGTFHSNDSSDSVDSTDSSSTSSSIYSSMYGGGVSRNGRETSSMSSSIGGRSPSPYAPMFGSSFTTARSSAALHSTLMASMMTSSTSPGGLGTGGSLRYSSSSLSGNESSRSQHQRRHQQRQHQQQMMKLGTTSASSWMSMNMNINTGSILSALSFTVPSYNFDEDMSTPLGSMEEEIAAM